MDVVGAVDQVLGVWLSATPVRAGHTNLIRPVHKSVGLLSTESDYTLPANKETYKKPGA